MTAPSDSHPSQEDIARSLFEGYMARKMQGSAPDFEALCTEHPEHARRLRSEKKAWDAMLGILDRLGSSAYEGSSGEDLGTVAASDDQRELRHLRESLQRLEQRQGNFDRYRLEGEVARGGMGVILRAWDGDLERPMAMKLVIGRASDPSGSGTPPVEARRLGRFLEEAQVTGQLDHPGIVPVHELGLTPEGQLYFTMKLVKGRELEEIFEEVHGLRAVQAEQWTRARAVSVLLKVCEAMAYAHDKGVVHRDLKPTNVMVGAYGEVYVMDWGLARVVGRKDRHDLRPERERDATTQIRSTRDRVRKESSDSPLVTMDGTVLGTPAYMPPEQAAGRIETVGPHSDVYAVGAMLYHLLAGHAPYLHEGGRMNRRALLKCVIAGPPPPLHELGAARGELQAICEKAMARDLDDRYPSMGALANDLRNWFEGRVVQAYERGALAELKKWVRRNKALAATALFALVVVVGGSVGGSVVLAGKKEKLEGVNRELTSRGYETAIAAADGALRAGDAAQAQPYLAGIEPELRAWEWYWLAGQADMSESTLYGHCESIRSLAIGPHGKRLVTHANDDTVRSWDLELGKELFRFEIPAPGWPHEVTFSSSTNFVAAPLQASGGDQPRDLGVWDTRSGKLLRRVTIGEAGWIPAAFSDDDRFLAAGGQRLVLIDLAEDRELLRKEVPSALRALTFSPDGSTLAARTRADSIVLMEAKSGEARTQPIRQPEPKGRTLAFSPDGRFIAAPTGVDAVQLWDVETGQASTNLRGDQNDVWSLDFHPDGRRILVGTSKGELRVWDLKQGGLTATLLGHRLGARALFLPSGHSLVSASHDCTIKLWTLPEMSSSVPEPQATGTFRIVASADGRRALLREGDGSMRVFDVASGRVLWSSPAEENGYPWAVLEPGGEFLARTEPENAIGILRTEDGERLATLRGHEQLVYDLAIDPAGERLASASVDQELRLWSVPEGKLLRVFSDATAPLRTVNFDSSGTRLIAADDSSWVRVWDSDSGRLLASARGSGQPIWDAQILDDGQRVATLSGSGSGEYVLELWDFDANGGLQVARRREIERFPSWGRMAVVPHPDGRRFVIDRPSTVPLQIFEAREGRRLVSMHAPLGLNYGLLGFFGEDGEELRVYDDHGDFWNFDTRHGRRFAERLDARGRASQILEEVFREEGYLERALDRLTADANLDEAVRIAALERVLAEGRDRRKVLAELRSALVSPSVPPATIKETLERTHRFADWGPDDASIRTLLALANYRAGRYEEARHHARIARERRRRAHPMTLGILTMSTWQLGLAGEAREHLAELRQLANENRLAGDSAALAILMEAEALVQQPAPGEGQDP